MQSTHTTLAMVAAIAMQPPKPRDEQQVAVAQRIKAVLTRNVLAFFGPDLLATEITQPMVDEWQRQLIAKNISPTYIERNFWWLVTILRRAHAAGLLAKPPKLKRSAELKAFELQRSRESWERIKQRREQRLRAA